MEGYIGEMKMFAGTFAPRNWAFCEGQELAIASYTALFSIIGTQYGGNGTTTMGLPDLRGRAPMGLGSGAGLHYAVKAGEKLGNDQQTLTIKNLPEHTHSAATTISGNPTLNAYNTAIGTGANSSDPTDRILSDPNAAAYSDKEPNVTMNEASISVQGMAAETVITPIGGNEPIEIVSPSYGIRFIICTLGIYPDRP
jgi:microcystin-dependent protein